MAYYFFFDSTGFFNVELMERVSVRLQTGLFFFSTT